MFWQIQLHVTVIVVALLNPVKGQSVEEGEQTTPGRGFQLCWTPWINHYRGTEGEDDEVFSPTDLYIHNVCQKPLAVDVARVDGKDIVAKLNCVFLGCNCRDYEQEEGVVCVDYKVRFLCPCRTSETIRTKLACHNGRSIDLHCEFNEGIRIKSAFYGIIWLSKCGLGPAKPKCHSNSNAVKSYLQQRCAGNSTCNIEAPPAESYNNGSLCLSDPRHVHVEYECRALCVMDGHRYQVGDVFIDPMCKYKCYCFRGGRFFCIPLCPSYGVTCNEGGVIRLRAEPSRIESKCMCAVPTCDER